MLDDTGAVPRGEEICELEAGAVPRDEKGELATDAVICDDRPLEAGAVP